MSTLQFVSTIWRRIECIFFISIKFFKSFGKCLFFIYYYLLTLGAVQKLCQPKMGGPDPRSLLCKQMSAFPQPALPPLSALSGFPQPFSFCRVSFVGVFKAILFLNNHFFSFKENTIFDQKFINMSK